ncbi:hypothetical protein AnigIFM50267_006088 [Aspergillus niger]|nr:hypothetical protein AnigIFM50267_006088 [Aspergillus niger]
MELERLINISKDKSTLARRIGVQTQQKLQDLEERMSFYEQLVEELSTNFHSEVSGYIANSLKSLTSRSHALKEPQRSRSISSSSSMGSLDDIDTVDIDVNRDRQSRSTGFVGKGSEIAWLQRLQAEVGGLERPGTEQKVKHDKGSLASLNYHLDNLVIAEPSYSDLNAMPPKPWADQLLHTYFSFIHPTFPLLLKPLFYQQYENAFRNRLSAPQQSWLVIFNLVHAIGAKHFQLRQEHWDEDVDDRIFLSRAIALNAKHNTILDYVDLQQVQIRMLLALYYLVAGQINRSLFSFYLTDLAVIGHAAIRSVYSLQSLSGTPSEKQHQISKYQKKLEEWLSSLKEYWSFTDSHGHYTKSMECREKILLAFSFYSIEIVLNRPCLTRPEFQKNSEVRRPRSRFDDDKALDLSEPPNTEKSLEVGELWAQQKNQRRYSKYQKSAYVGYFLLAIEVTVREMPS